MGPGEVLKVARIRAGYKSATAAARAFGWAPATYCGHENGYRGITVAAAKRYAQAFGLNDPSTLLDIASVAEELDDPDHEQATARSGLSDDWDRSELIPPAEETSTAPVQGLVADLRRWSTAINRPVDRFLARAIVALADAYEESDAPGRESLLIRFWSHFPDLRVKERRRRSRGGQEASSRPKRRRSASAGG